ncbi:SDR family NAD(P)-dependent oxidoreductase [Halosolutus gelatinilyticus]|uniref:SDR family NAD(P)-dependent oxidoreductase n=1 Tax=Halosolutus gelatinilyticus TaxID=2931975 RepID=UPI001FF5FE53|nr:SDR family NAD(P)-dependent oxidoreductase [Halosolutus gelatinilyticus]
MSLAERTALITGASSGIGRGIATELAAAGANIVVADIREEPKRGEHYQTDATVPTADLVEAESGVEATFAETDVTRESDIEAAIEAAVTEFGGLDVLVNNVGTHVHGTSQELTAEEWHRVVDVNLTSYFLAAKYAVPHLVESEQGRIVNVSSVNAYEGGAGPPYSATKAAIVNLTRDLALEVADAGVTVNTVLPGVVKTPMQDQNDAETRRSQAERTALPRVGEPSDVGAAVRFFASDRAEWITGAELLVDGGYAIGGY